MSDNWRYKYPEAAARKRWLERAQEHGFSDENEMWEYLIKDQSYRALGDLFGVYGKTVRARFIACGVKNPRGRGGGNNRKSWKKDRELMRKNKDYWGFILRMEGA